MRIQHNISAINTQRQLAINNNATNKSLEKLSSGYKINRAADDAAGLAISEKMRSQVRGLNRASANAQDGISLIQAAEGALQADHSMLQRMRELAVQAANDVNATVDRTAIKNESDQLRDEITRNADTTKFNDMLVLNGDYSANGINLQIGANSGAEQIITVTIGSMDATALSITNLLHTSNSHARASVASIDTAIQAVSDLRSKLGSVQNRLEYTVANLDTISENLQNAEGRIRDVDMAKEMMEFTKNSILNQAATAMLAQANQLPQGVLQLLQ